MIGGEQRIIGRQEERIRDFREGVIAGVMLEQVLTLFPGGSYKERLNQGIEEKCELYSRKLLRAPVVRDIANEKREG